MKHSQQTNDNKILCDKENLIKYKNHSSSAIALPLNVDLVGDLIDDLCVGNDLLFKSIFRESISDLLRAKSRLSWLEDMFLLDPPNFENCPNLAIAQIRILCPIG